jgi:hypothetical protein
LYFNNTLINSFYNYTRKIIEEEKNSWKRKNEIYLYYNNKININKYL